MLTRIIHEVMKGRLIDLPLLPSPPSHGFRTNQHAFHKPSIIFTGSICGQDEVARSEILGSWSHTKAWSEKAFLPIKRILPLVNHLKTSMVARSKLTKTIQMLDEWQEVTAVPCFVRESKHSVRTTSWWSNKTLYSVSFKNSEYSSGVSLPKKMQL
jgi:hypothetical protein